MTINPSTLKHLRGFRSLSQDDLAAASGVSKKTIARIETSKAKKPNASTKKRLAHALNVTVHDLSQTPDKLGDLGKKSIPSGYRKLTETISGDAHLSFDMVHSIYGISRQTQVDMAPLLMALFAEASLASRRKKLADIDVAVADLMAMGTGHLSFTNAALRVQDAACGEEDSIAARDVFGKKVAEDTFELGFDPGLQNPFADFLRDFASEVSSEFIELDSYGEPWINANGMPDYRVGRNVIEKITGDDYWAKYALESGRVHVGDIPKEFMNVEKQDERINWLSNKIPHEDRKRIDEENRALFASI